jgi:hypothetical protein
MGTNRDAAMKKLREELAEIARINRLAFEGEYGDELKELQGLSQDDLDAISPKVSNAADYANLMEVVRQASATNLSVAALKDRIEALGTEAVKIAKLVPELAARLL